MTVIPDSKVSGANMGPTWGRQDPGGPYVDLMNLAIWDVAIWDASIDRKFGKLCHLLDDKIALPMSVAKGDMNIYTRGDDIFDIQTPYLIRIVFAWCIVFYFC